MNMKNFIHIIMLLFCLGLWGCEDNSPVSFDYDFSGVSAKRVVVDSGTFELRILIPAVNRNCFTKLEIYHYIIEEYILRLEFASGNVSKIILSDDEVTTEDLPNGDLLIKYPIDRGFCVKLYVSYSLPLRYYDNGEIVYRLVWPSGWRVLDDECMQIDF